MATAHPASSQAGSQPEPHQGLKSQAKMDPVNTGIELNEALPVANPPVVSGSIPPANLKKAEPTVEGSETSQRLDVVPDALVIAGVDESSASHLGGSSAADIQSVDAKFQRLLTTVHENRPADDLEII